MCATPKPSGFGITASDHRAIVFDKEEVVRRLSWLDCLPLPLQQHPPDTGLSKLLETGQKISTCKLGWLKITKLEQLICGFG